MNDAEVVACPTCGAAPGARCRQAYTPGRPVAPGRTPPTYARRPHLEREHLALLSP